MSRQTCFKLLCLTAIVGLSLQQTPAPGEQKWNYVKVRPTANMFWWLYKTTHPDGVQNRPLVLWLQGGPGASSTGYGNFELIGPLDVDLKPRNYTWLQSASLLFVDNPVGAGYSYASDNSGFTTDVAQIAQDLVTLTKAFLNEVPEYKTVPLYIVGESYGGKMGAEFAKLLDSEIKAGNVECNLKLQAMGDAWISPVDYVTTWGPYLYYTSIVDERGLSAINETAMMCKDAVNNGQWELATDLYGATQGDVNEHSNFVDFYNILRFRTGSMNRGSGLRKVLGHGKHKRSLLMEHMVNMNVDRMYADKLSELMNGAVKDYLGIIPDNVTWGGQRGDVFVFQRGDFMKPVISTVDYLLDKTNVKSVIYNGMLDLICDTPGTNVWVQKLQWDSLGDFNVAERVPLMSPVDQQTNSFVKTHKGLTYYYVMRAGHMVPKDNPEGGLQMLEHMIANTP